MRLQTQSLRRRRDLNPRPSTRRWMLCQAELRPLLPPSHRITFWMPAGYWCWLTDTD